MTEKRNVDHVDNERFVQSTPCEVSRTFRDASSSLRTSDSPHLTPDTSHLAPLRAAQAADLLTRRGFRCVTGVPCSLLGELIAALERDPVCRYVPAVREDAAIGLASGAYLGGQQAAVLMQNSGLGYSLNVLTSLNLIYRIPVLLVISYRGFGGKDAPEHLVMGRACEPLLTTVGIPHRTPEPDGVLQALEWAIETMQAQRVPVGLLIRKGIFDRGHG